MTELLRELEAVVSRMEAIKVANWDVDTAELSATRIAVIDFVHDHHAEIAEALSDARRWLYVLNNAEWIRDEDDTLMAIRLPPLTDLSSKGTRRDAIDAAIDAHNSAREVGE